MNSGPGNANLGSKVGFIYGAVALIGLIWAFFYFPELKGRSLEEVDEMFAAGVSARKSRSMFRCLHPRAEIYQRLIRMLRMGILEP